MSAWLQQQEEQQEENKTGAKVAFVDASWYHRPGRDAAAEYRMGPRLPNARFVDVDGISTTKELFPESNPRGLPHMMPPARLFALAMDALDIRNNDHVVIYGRRGVLFTPRTWFLFRSFGHTRVHLLQGSLEDWQAAGGPLHHHNEPSFRSSSHFQDCFQDGILHVPHLVRNYYHTWRPRYVVTNVWAPTNVVDNQFVLNVVNTHLNNNNNTNNNNNNGNNHTLIIDTRGSSFAKQGHMPSAIHLPYSLLVSPDNPLIFRTNQQLHQIIYEQKGIHYQNEHKRNIVFTCGSGVSVCHGILALEQLGRNVFATTTQNHHNNNDHHATTTGDDNDTYTVIYDGSWAEWGQDKDLPKILPNIDKN